MKLGIAQIITKPGDFDYTLAKVRTYTKYAADKHCDLLVFPQTLLFERTGDTAWLSEYFFAEQLLLLEHLRTVISCPCLVPVAFCSDAVTRELIFDYFVVSPELYLPVKLDFSRFFGAQPVSGDEDRSQAPIPSFSWSGCRIGLVDCSGDLEVFSAEEHDLDLCLYLANRPFQPGLPNTAFGEALLESRYALDACFASCPLAVVSEVGLKHTRIYPGSSFVLDAEGSPLALAPSFEEALITADIKPRKAAGADVDEEAYDATAHEEAADDTTSDTPITPAPYDPGLLLIHAIIYGIREAIQASDSVDACMLLEPSPESCLLLCLLADALGPEHVFVLVSQECFSYNFAPLDFLKNLGIDDAQIKVFYPPETEYIFNDDDLARCFLEDFSRRQGALVFEPIYPAAVVLKDESSLSSSAFAPFMSLNALDILGMIHTRNTLQQLIPLSSLPFRLCSELEDFLQEFPSPEACVAYVDRILDAVRNNGFLPHSFSDLDARQDFIRTILKRYAAVLSRFGEKAQSLMFSVVHTDCARFAGALEAAAATPLREVPSDDLLRESLFSFMGALSAGVQQDIPESDEEQSLFAVADDDPSRRFSELVGYLQDLTPGGLFDMGISSDAAAFQGFAGPGVPGALGSSGIGDDTGGPGGLGGPGGAGGFGIFFDEGFSEN